MAAASVGGSLAGGCSCSSRNFSRPSARYRATVARVDAERDAAEPAQIAARERRGRRGLDAAGTGDEGAEDEGDDGQDGPDAHQDYAT